MSRTVQQALSVELLDAFNGNLGELLTYEVAKLREQIPDANVLIIRVEKW